jgi:hypothetical protein
MVSSALKMDLEDLLRALRRIRLEHGDSAEYRTWRLKFPEEWPI